MACQSSSAMSTVQPPWIPLCAALECSWTPGTLECTPHFNPITPQWFSQRLWPCSGDPELLPGAASSHSSSLESLRRPHYESHPCWKWDMPLGRWCWRVKKRSGNGVTSCWWDGDTPAVLEPWSQVSSFSLIRRTSSFTHPLLSDWPPSHADRPRSVECTEASSSLALGSTTVYHCLLPPRRFQVTVFSPPVK